LYLQSNGFIVETKGPSFASTANVRGAVLKGIATQRVSRQQNPDGSCDLPTATLAIQGEVHKFLALAYVD
jgi:hypothetical protein